MKNISKILGIGILAAGIVIYIFTKQPAPNNSQDSMSNPKNTSYTIEGNSIFLANGKATYRGAAGQTLQTGTFGEPVFGDLDKDGKNEAVIYITQSSGASGTFFYAAGAEEINGEWKGTNTIFLGDRIAPQNINIIDGVANFNFATRKENDPFTVSPSVGVTKRFVISNGELVENK